MARRFIKGAGPLYYFLLSTLTLPLWICSEKNSLTEHPALPEEAQAQAHAQLDAHAQLEAQEDAHEEAHEERGLDPRLTEPRLPEDLYECLTGVLITFTRIKVSGEFP